MAQREAVSPSMTVAATAPRRPCSADSSTKHDKAKIATWTWDTYLACAEKLFKAGYPVGLPMGQTADSVDWVGALFNAYGVVMVDAKDNIRINSDQTREALEYLRRLMAVNPPEVYAWDDAGNNRWLISGEGSGIMNPPSAWAVAKRDNPKVAENCSTHPMPKGPLVGHSTGGAIGQTLAATHPDRLLSLVISASWTKADPYFRRTCSRSWITSRSKRLAVLAVNDRRRHCPEFRPTGRSPALTRRAPRTARGRT